MSWPIILKCAQDAVIDSLQILPFLFAIFLIIEILEYFYFEKLSSVSKYSGASGPLIGAILASLPQCGFSVIASLLYVKRYITKGTLIAVYISTSDEAIPVLLAEPGKFKLILPIILMKIIIGSLTGYIVDFFFPSKVSLEKVNDTIHEKGCCNHSLEKPKSNELFIHPILHTLNVIFFVFVVTFALNITILLLGGESELGKILLENSHIQPVAAAFFGLIPNCAISVAITLMYIKGILTFGSAIAGLSSGAGLGILVLIRKNQDKFDTAVIIATLLFVSIAAGVLISLVF